MKKSVILILFIILISSSFIFFKGQAKDDRFITYEVDLNDKEVKLYWKDEKDNNFKSIQNLKNWLETKDQTLLFATNGGMYKKDNTPQGLFIENFETKSNIDTLSGNGNFYLKPNGVFYIADNNQAKIDVTENFNLKKNIKFATQSGPMLVINNIIHSAFNENSKNLNIRNGVGVLENGNIVFCHV
ncbi:phosphodiester glycosidase family protein [Flavobacterium sp. N1861]|uniref:phosphodiester glycosidase family protein n=1 Tax=Flavobacterium sp. N1861 TaxID=2986825 RepID=UPI0022248557|nr:phosphodiester glycosidase family protein [Flavobacterium sp. N1861]